MGYRMLPRISVLAGILLAACSGSSALAQDEEVDRGRLELSIFGTQGPENVLDNGSVDTYSFGVRLGYFATRSLALGVGFERVERQAQTWDKTLQLVEPFLQYHFFPNARFVPYVTLEGEQRVDLSTGAFGLGVGAGARYYFNKKAALFLEGRLQLYSSPGDRTPVGAGIAAFF